MASQFVAVFALLVVAASAQHHQQHNQHQNQHYVAAPVYAKAVVAAPVYHKEEEHAPAEYQFSYQVHDEHTGDIKSHQESRHGDNVQGKYTLVDADGHHRTVEYTADKHSGFNAVVHREPIKGFEHHQQQPQHHQQQPQHNQVKYVAPVAHHQPAPVVHYQSAPIVHHQSAPVFHHHAAPVVHHQAAPLSHAQNNNHHAGSQVSFSDSHHNYHY